MSEWRTCSGPKLTPCELLKWTALVLVALIWLGAFASDSLDAQRPPPTPESWVDFAVSSVATTPLAPSRDDLVVFHANVQILQKVGIFHTAEVLWVKVHCFLDGNFWREENLIFSERTAVDVYTQVPWNATLGPHEVTWVADPKQEYNDPNLEDNAMSYQFLVGEPMGNFDFSISASPNWRAAGLGESTSYQVSIYMTRAEIETVYLSMRGAPLGLAFSFSPAQASSSYSSNLSVMCGAVPNVYYLNVSATAQTRSYSVTLVLVVEPTAKQNSSISIFVTPTSQTLGKNVTVSGAISPPHGAIVTLQYTRPEGLTFATLLKSESDGTFVYSFTPDTVGPWTFSAVWAGDSDHLETESSSVTLHVNEAPSSPATEFWKQLETMPVDFINTVAVLLVILFFATLVCALIVVGI